MRRQRVPLYKRVYGKDQTRWGAFLRDFGLGYNCSTCGRTYLTSYFYAKHADACHDKFFATLSPELQEYYERQSRELEERRAAGRERKPVPFGARQASVPLRQAPPGFYDPGGLYQQGVHPMDPRVSSETVATGGHGYSHGSGWYGGPGPGGYGGGGWW